MGAGGASRVTRFAREFCAWPMTEQPALQRSPLRHFTPLDLLHDASAVAQPRLLNFLVPRSEYNYKVRHLSSPLIRYGPSY